MVAVSDTCGFGQNYVISISNNLRIFATNATNTQCPGDDVLMSVPNINGASYQWFKNNNPIIGATTHELQLTNIQVATDAGVYKLEVEMPDCDLTTNSFNLLIDCTALPLNLTSFTAYKNGKVSELKWETENEHQNKGFEVERSTNGITWTKLGYIASIANKNNLKNNYQYTDNNPVNGKNMYRLKQLDIDGKYEYSTVRTVWFENGSNDISIHPNPAKESITISGLLGNENIQVYDIVGKLVQSAKAKESTLTISIDNFTDGVYFIRVINPNGTVSAHKFIKKN